MSKKLKGFQILLILSFSFFLSSSISSHSFIAYSLLLPFFLYNGQTSNISLLSFPLLAFSFSKYLSLLRYHVYTLLKNTIYYIAWSFLQVFPCSFLSGLNDLYLPNLNKTSKYWFNFKR